MSGVATYSAYAVLYELNTREFRKKLELFPPEQRYYVVLAGSIIGAANAERLREKPGASLPEAVVRDGIEFSEKLLEMSGAAEDESFRDLLETYLTETIKDELKCCCQNCQGFNRCIDVENLSVGHLFRRRANGEETDDLKKKIAAEVSEALENTPYTDTDRADQLCRDFVHQYSLSTIGELFGRYADIASELQRMFGIDYRKIQHSLISLNMEFAEKSKTAKAKTDRGELRAKRPSD